MPCFALVDQFSAIPRKRISLNFGALRIPPGRLSNISAQQAAGIKKIATKIIPKALPRNFYGVPFRIRLDSRLTALGKEISLRQQGISTETKRSAPLRQSLELQSHLVHVALGKPIPRTQQFGDLLNPNSVSDQPADLRFEFFLGNGRFTAGAMYDHGNLPFHIALGELRNHFTYRAAQILFVNLADFAGRRRFHGRPGCSAYQPVIPANGAAPRRKPWSCFQRAATCNRVSRSCFFAGRKPSKTKRSVGKPLALKTVATAEGPGSGIT